jgi:hypothetical protein
MTLTAVVRRKKSQLTPLSSFKYYGCLEAWIVVNKLDRIGHSDLL